MGFDLIIAYLAHVAVRADLNRESIYAVSVIFCAGLSANLFWVRRRFLAEEPWIRWIAWTFAVLGTTHLIRYLDVAAWHGTPLKLDILRFLMVTLSGVSSVLMLVGSLDLLGRPRPSRWILALPTLVPVLGFLMHILFPSAPGTVSAYELIASVLDGAVSAVVLVIFGLALHRNVALASYARPLRALIWVPTALYAVALLLDPFVEWGVQDGCTALIDPIRTELQSASAATPLPSRDVGEVWWSLVVAATLAFKATAGVPLWKLVMDRLPFVAAPRRIYGEEDGGVDALVRVARRQFRADLAEIYLAIPGRENPRVLRFWWDPEQERVRREVENRYPAERSVVSRCLVEGGGARFSPDWRADPMYRDAYRELIPGMRSFITVPVVSGGETVGALNLEWGRVSPFGPSTVALATTLAGQLTPALRAHRGFEAVSEFNRRIVDLRAMHANNPDWKLNRAVEACVGILNDLMGSHAVRIVIECGFKRRPVFGRRSEDVLDWEDIQDDEVAGVHTFIIDSAALKLGRMLLVGKPGATLPFDLVVFQILARSIADVALDAARESAAQILARRQSASQSVRTPEELSELVERICADADLIWLGFDGLPDLLCPTEARTYVLAESEESLDISLSGGRHRLVPAQTPDEPVRLCIRLGVSKAVAWFAIALGTFGHELQTASPWSEFIERLGVLIDAALVRIRDAAQVSATVFDAAQRQAVHSFAVATGTAIHQITNLTRDLSAGTRNLEESIECKETQTTEEIKHTLKGLSKSARNLEELTSAIMESVRFRHDRPCDLTACLEQVRKLFQAKLSLSEITLEIEVPGRARADAPTYVLALAVANLISNACDAIKRGGSIHVRAELDGESWCIAVRDSGPGIPEEVRDRLFRLGTTTREGGTGWGLYLTRQSLREHRGDIWLAQSAAGSTTFIVRAPVFIEARPIETDLEES